MSRVMVYEVGTDDWEVWIGLDDEDPLESPVGFCLGHAATRDGAVAQAVADLEAAVAELQRPPLSPGGGAAVSDDIHLRDTRLDTVERLSASHEDDV